MAQVGVGTAVIRSLAESARSRHLLLTLSVLHVNPRARALYERLSFTEVERDDAAAKLALDPREIAT